MKLGRPSIPLNKKYIEDRIIVTNDCWHWKGSKRPDGYGKTSSRRNNKIKQYLAHRLSYCIWTGMKMDSPLLVLHKCNNKICVNPDHLYAGTQYQNVQDYLRIGIRPRLPSHHADGNPNSKLSLAQCKEIAYLLKKGMSLSKIAVLFNVSIKPIHDIRKKKTLEQSKGI